MGQFLVFLLSLLFAMPSAAQKKVELCPPEARAWSLETSKLSDWPWDVQKSFLTTGPVKAGDRLLASFKARALKPGQAGGEVFFVFGFEGTQAPIVKSVDWAGRAGSAWKRINIPFEAAADAGAGEARFFLAGGYAPQKLEVKDFTLVNLGPSVSLEKLPRSVQTWPGREEGAKWRKDAEKRIQAIRTAPVSIRVVDAAGKPLAKANIHVRQVKSAFRFGTAVSSKMLFSGKPGPDLDRYKETVARYFNIITEENSLKWKAISGDLGPEFGLDRALKCSDWARELGLDFRGHCLLWPSWRNSPKLAENLKNDPKGLRQAILKHVRETAATMKGRVVDWDVVNEPWDNHDVMDALGGDQIITDCYQLAHQVDPQARLFINDYAILEGGAGDTNHRARYEAVIRKLLETGVPLEGIGIQGHFAQPLTAPVDMLNTLDRFAAFGRKILITEYDIEEKDAVLAGDFLRDLLTLCYSHPAVEGFIMWGFWDGKHWHKNAPLFNKDWSPKPALKVWEDLVMKKWKTDVRGKSGKDGRLALPAHLGDYEITVGEGAEAVTRQAKLGNEGLNLVIEVPR